MPANTFIYTSILSYPEKKSRSKHPFQGVWPWKNDLKGRCACAAGFWFELNEGECISYGFSEGKIVLIVFGGLILGGLVLISICGCVCGERHHSSNSERAEPHVYRIQAEQARQDNSNTDPLSVLYRPASYYYRNSTFMQTTTT